jgi:ribonuclease HI
MVDYCQLLDLGFSGPKFTWCNRQEGVSFVKERLDRGMANSQWCELFPTQQVSVLAARSSDHAPLFLSLQGSDKLRRGGSKRFHYETGWQKNGRVHEVIRQVWRVKASSRDVWGVVRIKMENSKRGLLQWKRTQPQHTETELQEKTAAIQTLQAADGVFDMGAVRGLQKEVDEILEQDELKWRQRAKEHWLQMGDKNTKFFHASATQQKRKNVINMVQDMEGRSCTTPEAIQEAFLGYFQSIFTSTEPTSMEDSIAYLSSKVSSQMNEQLLGEFTSEEVSMALSQMAPLKAPGPDGFPVCFFQDNWDRVGRDVCAAALHFFNTGCLDESINLTHIALIPKMTNPTKVSDFRPISLCNVFYKILSKVLANRLKVILPHIISKNQSAFIPGRLISDNILVAYESLHTMHARMWGKVGYMALKLDMSKAYDRVEWGFLEAVMQRMGFDRRWIFLIMQCISTVRYSVIVNGEPVGLIRPSRGLRQGDPLSPYLFILCAEVLSSQLHHAAGLGVLPGVPTSRGGPKINHLFFADDSLLFCRACLADWVTLTNLLENYERGSGQRLNKDKTSIFFSRNTSQEDRRCILQLSGIPATQRYDKYLGLPALVGKSRIREFQSIIDRVKGRVLDWKVKFLSQAGKEILLKAVVQAIPTYSMSIFLLPTTLCKELNSIMQKFWWGHKANDKKIHWMSWERMGFAKDNGGMGFRDLVAFNKALLAKQWWRMVQEPDSLVGQILRAKYFPRVSFQEAKLGSRPSYAWRSLMAARELFLDGLCWRIGNGTSVSIWHDKWLPCPSTFKVQSPCRELPEDALVSDLMDPSTGEWNKMLLGRIFWAEEAEVIGNLPLSRYRHPDKLVWRATKSGMFTVRSAYHLEKERRVLQYGAGSTDAEQTGLWRFLWRLGVPNSTKVFLWRACHNILPTKDNLFKRGIVQDDGCPFCLQVTESVGHILWECPSSCDVWGSCRQRSIQKAQVHGVCFQEIFEGIISRCCLADVCFVAVLSKKLWTRRNTVVHGGTFAHPNQLIQEAENLLATFGGVQSVRDRLTHGVEEDGPVKWNAPPFGRYKINWDVAIDTIHKCLGVGIIVRDYQGFPLAAQSKTYNVVHPPVVAEALGALRAAEFSRDLGFQDVILEGDSLAVVQDIQSLGSTCIAHGQIVEDTRFVLNSHRSWMIGHTKRNGNQAAHGLAKYAVRNHMDQTWLEDIPDCVSVVVNLERSALSI